MWPLFCVSQMRQDRARHAHQAEDIRFINAHDLRVAGFLDRARQTMAGVVDEHVNAAEFCDRLFHDRRNIFLISQVQRNGE
jgi:hypothetical protein